MVLTMAEEAGHTVMWSPPHHSYLHPIELVWANVKGTVRRQYTTTTTLADVKRSINSAFATLEPKMVAACIKKANNILVELLDHIMVMEVIEEDEESTDSSDDESDNDILGDQ